MTSPIQSSIKKVQRRVATNRVLKAFGWAVLVGLLAATAMLVVDRLLPMTVIPAWSYGIAGGTALIIALCFALGSLPRDEDAAVLLDEKLGLKDKLGTALYTATLEEQNELTEQVAREADEAAQQARVMVDQAAPIEFARVWNYTPIAAAVLLAVLFLVPEDLGDPLGQVAAAEAEAEEKRIAEEGEVIINTIQESLDEPDEESDQKIAEGLPDELRDQIVSLSDEIRKDPGSAEEKLKEAESLISDAESRLGEQADVIEATFNPLQSAASGLDPGQTGPADEFTRAMNQGDFEKAKEALAEMQKAIEEGTYSEDERQQLQQQLNNIAQQLDQQAQQAQQAQQQAQQNAQQQMAQQLQQSGMSQQQAQQQAQQMSQQMQQNMQQGQQNQQGQQGQNQQQNQQGQNQQGQQGQQGQQMTQQQMQQQLQQALQQQGMSQQQAQQQAQQMVQQMQQQMQQGQGQQQSGQMQQQLSQGLQQMSQQSQQAGQQGQQQGQQGQQQGQQGGQSAQQAINQMAQMQQQLQQMQQQQGQMQQAMQQMQQMQNQGGGQGGKPGSWGDAEGGNPFGPQSPGYQSQSYAAQDIQQGEGRVIASWTENGEVAPGEATVEYNASRTEAVQAAERAVTEDRTPRRYHEAIKDYFQQLPEDPNAGRAPAAPR
ncbi:MAG: hypothetical protein AAGI37_08865 [Planctomycetota bacterium]